MRLVSLFLVLSAVACGRSSVQTVDAGTDARVDMKIDAGIDVGTDSGLGATFPPRVIVRGISGGFEMLCCKVAEVRPDRILLNDPCGVWIVLDGTFTFEEC